MIESFLIEKFGEGAILAYQVFYILLAILVPSMLLFFAWRFRLAYLKNVFFRKEGWTLLEIHIPEEIKKTPQAMEMVLESMNVGSGESNFIMRLWHGMTRPWFSLEIVSFEGRISFFIWTRKRWKAGVVAAIYSQYPTVEINEVDDYTKQLPTDLEKYIVWGSEMDLKKPDPYPIKTYKYYEMDKDQDEDLQPKTDPLSSFIEALGSIGPGEYFCFQIIIRKHKKEKKVQGSLFKKQSWREEGKEIVKKLKTGDQVKSVGEDNQPIIMLSNMERSFIESMERNLSKHAFDCGMRILYITEKNSFDVTRLSTIPGALGQFGDEIHNSFDKARGHDPMNWFWQDVDRIRGARISKRIFDAYRFRAYFHMPYISPHFTLSAEEVASVFHFPGKVVTTPTFERIRSKKAEAPVNIPQ